MPIELQGGSQVRYLSTFVHSVRAILVVIALVATVVFAACGSDPTPQLLPTATPLPPTPTPQPFRGQWRTVTDETDPLTRVGDVEIRLRQKDDGVSPALYIRCQKEKDRVTPMDPVLRDLNVGLYELDFIILWSETPIESSQPDGFEVQHRIDDGPIESLTWYSSTSGRATFLPRGRIIEMIKKLFDANEFVAQVELKESETITAVFEPDGIYWTVKPVLAACGQEID